MENFKQIYEYVRPWYVSSLNVCRECDQGIATVLLEVTNDRNKDLIKLVGLNDFNAVSSILEAEMVKISEEVGCQREFGSIRLECFNDGSYAEYWCDSVLKT